MRGPPRPPVFGTKHRAGGDIKTVADEKAQFWHSLWLATPDSESGPCRAPPLGYRFDLPMPTVMQTRALLRTYPWTTAVGADAWRPRSLELLSDEMIACMIHVLTGMVKLCANPIDDRLARYDS